MDFANPYRLMSHRWNDGLVVFDTSLAVSPSVRGHINM